MRKLRSRIKELEKTLSAKELEIHQLHDHIEEITQELTGLRKQLRQAVIGVSDRAEKIRFTTGEV